MRLLVIQVAVSLMMLGFAVTSFGSDAPTDVQKAAKEGMKEFLRPSEIDYLHLHGFKSKDEIDNAVLGEAFQVFMLDPKKLLEESNCQDLQSFIVPTNLWNFLI